MAESGRLDVFKVKWTRYKGHKVPFLLQNTDGECPLICLSNVLLLKKKFELPYGCKTVGFHSLCSYICSTLPHANSEWVTSILKSLKKGLIFNCRFDSTKALIESDTEQLFLSFDVPIKHGWIPDPLAYGVLSKYNYDQLLENLAIYQSKDSEEYKLESELEKMSLTTSKEDKVVKEERDNVELKEENTDQELIVQDTEDTVDKTDKPKNEVNMNQNNNNENVEENRITEENKYNLLVKEKKENNERQLEEKENNEQDEFDEATATLAIEFLDRYATQLTEYGVKVLKNEIEDGSLVALYRNNHFLVATMHEGQIFTLVTDSSFYEHGCIWESLESCEYFDQNFNHYVQIIKEKPVKKPNFIEKFKKVFRRKPKRQ